MTTPTFEEFQKFSKQQLDAVNTAAASVAKGLQEIAAESSDYSKKAFASSSATVEKLLGAKSVETAVQIQTDYAKSIYDASSHRRTRSTKFTSSWRPKRSSRSRLRSPSFRSNDASERRRAKRGRVTVLTCQGRRRAGPFFVARQARL